MEDVKTVISQRLSSSKGGNGDSNSKAQVTQGNKGTLQWDMAREFLTKPGQRASQATELP